MLVLFLQLFSALKETIENIHYKSIIHSEYRYFYREVILSLEIKLYYHYGKTIVTRFQSKSFYEESMFFLGLSFFF